MATNTARLRDSVTALAALRFDQAQIIDGRVTNPGHDDVINVSGNAFDQPRILDALQRPADVVGSFHDSFCIFVAAYSKASTMCE